MNQAYGRLLPVSSEAVAKLPWPHETRRLSRGRIDGVEAARFHEDAIMKIVIS